MVIRTALIGLCLVSVFWTQPIWAKCPDVFSVVSGKVVSYQGRKGDENIYRNVSGAKIYLFINGKGGVLIKGFDPTFPENFWKKIKYVDYVTTTKDGTFSSTFKYNSYNRVDWSRERTGDGIHDCSGRPVFFDFIVIKEGYHPALFKGSSEKKYRKTPYNNQVKIEKGKNEELDRYSVDIKNIYMIKNKH